MSKIFIETFILTSYWCHKWFYRWVRGPEFRTLRKENGLRTVTEKSVYYYAWTERGHEEGCWLKQQFFQWIWFSLRIIRLLNVDIQIGWPILIWANNSDNINWDEFRNEVSHLIWYPKFYSLPIKSLFWIFIFHLNSSCTRSFFFELIFVNIVRWILPTEWK